MRSKKFDAWVAYRKANGIKINKTADLGPYWPYSRGVALNNQNMSALSKGSDNVTPELIQGVELAIDEWCKGKGINIATLFDHIAESSQFEMKYQEIPNEFFGIWILVHLASAKKRADKRPGIPKDVRVAIAQFDPVSGDAKLASFRISGHTTLVQGSARVLNHRLHCHGQEITVGKEEAYLVAFPPATDQASKSQFMRGILAGTGRGDRKSDYILYAGKFLMLKLNLTQEETDSLSEKLSREESRMEEICSYIEEANCDIDVIRETRFLGRQIATAYELFKAVSEDDNENSNRIYIPID